MAERSKIEWTDATVNFWWGCTKVGPGCDYCYAETWARRTGGNHWGVGVPRRKIKSAVPMLHRLDNGYADWAADHECAVGNARAFGLPHPGTQRRRRVFIQSMSDLFDTEVPLEWFHEAWEAIEACDRVTLYLLTKRISVVEKRLAAIGRTRWPGHAGLMITVVNQEEADRDVPRLLDLKARLGIPWVGLSCEPLLGPIDLAYVGIEDTTINTLTGWGRDAYHQEPVRTPRCDWVICGGESGRNARPMHPDWARALRDQCQTAGVPFFFKQWGEWVSVSEVAGPGRHYSFPDGATVRRVGKKSAGHLLDGKEHREFPNPAHFTPRATIERAIADTDAAGVPPAVPDPECRS